MENLQANIKEWETKALDLSQRLAQFNRVKGKVDRLKTLYDRLTNNLKEVDVSQVVGGEDQVSIMEMATPPVSVRPGLDQESVDWIWRWGLLAGIAYSLPARSHRRSHGLVRGVSASFLRKCARSNSEGKDQRQGHAASTGRCPPRFRRIIPQRPFLDFLHALRGSRGRKPFSSPARCRTKENPPSRPISPSPWRSPARAPC